LNLPWTNAGMPAVTLPAGHAAGGLPLGVQLVGPTEEDEMLLAWAELVAADL
jgi:Asp-tRNA(Asn)/Glu-tRNA(Gln) amidotransferase A subunit family amidase